MADIDAQKIEEIRALTERMAADRARIFDLIPQVFPEKRGEEQVRGRLNEVVKASGFTREYVARIRDGKVKPS
ncbi:hypothetical protein [Streptomyces sp. CBMA152]|uniref:hypothetical protein n=1 Tax=Streptomyces sp. CBMA152 TaxID=1896312 RepID=UPI00166115E0|nr:hypothetical protein [Streptomyces sp. CBMA152]MBD0743571.1 hypothetical protein [Streptomyces sp. CBMA152]